MTGAQGRFAIGPDTGRLVLRTGRQGVASRAGHDLTITFGTWSGELDVPADRSRATVQARVRLASIEIVQGTGGVAPLTGIDKRQITKTALRLLDADAHPEATFESTSVAADGDTGTLHGNLTVRGVAVPVSLAVSSTSDGWHAETTVLQSSFGIEPYRAFFGALRLADEVHIEVDTHTR
jgi:polyisoprenoid-binding protein YceI